MGVPIKRGTPIDLGGGVTLIKFKAFTGGKIFDFKLNSGNESPFHCNSFSMHVRKGEGTPSALNGNNVNPVLLGKVAEYLKIVKVAVAAKGGKEKAGMNLFLEPKKEAPPKDWASLNLAPADKPISTGLEGWDDNEIHG